MQDVELRVNRFAAKALALALFSAACQVGEPGPGSARPTPAQVQQPRVAPPPVSAAEQSRAAELLARARDLFGAGEYGSAREAAEEVVRQHPTTDASTPALWLAARAANEDGDYEAAEDLAERYAGLLPPGSAEARAALDLAARARRAREAADRPPPRPSGPTVIGVILPRSGSPYLTQYGDLILEGVRLAVEEERSPMDPPIELVVLDDAGDPETDARLISQLERLGAVGVIGPLLAPGVSAAARARGDRDLAIVSPTITERQPALENVYSLNTGDTQGADTLADYTTQAGLYRIGMLYPRIPAFERRARAFADAIYSSGAFLVTSVPYDSGTTTFGAALQGIAAVAPQALYVAAPERDVRQIAPQIQYYGLDSLGVRILGDEAWASPEVRRLVEPRFLEGVVVATPLVRSSRATAWQDFVDLYEQSYRRTLNNPFPALGYDAARLLLAAIDAGAYTAEDVANRLAEIESLRGATGIISVEGGEVTRQPFLVQIREGQLEAAPSPAIFGLPRILPGDSVAADSIP